METTLIPQIEYNLIKEDPVPVIKKVDQVEDEPFIPRPKECSFSSSDHNISAKPVGPHMSAPQFSYTKPATSQSEENPFEVTSFTREAQNSPHFNLQK